MANTPRQIITPVFLGTVEGLIYQCTSIRDVLSGIVLCNTTGDQVTVRLNHVPISQLSEAMNSLMRDTVIEPNQTVTLGRGATLAGGEMLRGLCSHPLAVTVSVYGVQVT